MTAPDIAQFVADRLDEAEATANAAAEADPLPWDLDDVQDKWSYGPTRRLSTRGGGIAYSTGQPLVAATAEHIASWNPAVVLRQVAALRRIAGMHGVNHQCVPIPGLIGWTEQPCPTLRAVASMWAGHPDYDTTWEQG